MTVNASARSTALHQRMWFQMATMLLAITLFHIVVGCWAVAEFVGEIGR